MAGTITSAFNDADELVSSSSDTTTWSYDPAGQLLRNGKSGLTATYNDRSGTATLGAASYITYAAGNNPTYNRSDSSVSTLYTVSSKMGLMAEDYGNQRIYDRTPTGGAVGSRLSGGSRYYFIADAIGSVIGMFDKDGGYYGGYTYGPFGEPRFSGSNAALANNHLRYIAGYYDTSSGLYRLGARYYDPSFGRFTQPDPIEGANENAYNYPNNPMTEIDPTGEYWVKSVTWMYG